MVRKIAIFTICALFLGVSQAQNLETFKESLMSPSELGVSAVVNEHPDARIALSKMATLPSKVGFLGYRIGVFFDNGPTARAKADEARELFEESFPQESVYMVYENPYFKVSGGNCVTQEEAVILLEKIQRVFPKAYIMREQMSVSDIIITEESSGVDTLPAGRL